MNQRSGITDTAAVTALLDDMVAAWAAGDAAGYAACFTPDADYVTFIGSHLTGHREIIDTHDALWATFQKDTRLHQEIDSIRFVTADVAIVVSRGAILKPRQTAPKRGDWKIQTLVAVRHGENWKFTAFQNTKHRWLFERMGAAKDPRLSPRSSR